MSTSQTVETITPAYHESSGGTASGIENAAVAPGQVRVIRRNGKLTAYDPTKIKVALTKAFLAVEGGGAAASARVHETVESLVALIDQALKRRLPGGGTVHIEDIQDQAELALMREGHHKVARAYVLYREQQ
ncbi:MAG TPA: ATP cone domain-containing protein, partial [Guyparkeria sp.]|nr:ATP cone domain-containing protein [Guyparkeria sp.]